MLSKNARSTTLQKREQIGAALVGNVRVIPVISRSRQKHVANSAPFHENVTYRGFHLWASTYFTGVAFNLLCNLFFKKTSLSCFGENRQVVFQDDNIFTSSNDFLQFFEPTELKVKCCFKCSRDKSTLPTAIP